jgi:hypothetical protein
MTDAKNALIENGSAVQPVHDEISGPGSVRPVEPGLMWLVLFGLSPERKVSALLGTSLPEAGMTGNSHFRGQGHIHSRVTAP